MEGLFGVGRAFSGRGLLIRGRDVEEIAVEGKESGDAGASDAEVYFEAGKGRLVGRGRGYGKEKGGGVLTAAT